MPNLGWLILLTSACQCGLCVFLFSSNVGRNHSLMLANDGIFYQPQLTLSKPSRTQMCKDYGEGNRLFRFILYRVEAAIIVYFIFGIVLYFFA